MVGTGIFYVAVTYAQTVGSGTNAAGSHAFASATSPPGTLGLHYIGNLMAMLMNVGATISAVASAPGTADANACMLFSLGPDGSITDRPGAARRRTGSPAIAVAVVVFLTFAVVPGWSRVPGVNGASALRVPRDDWRFPDSGYLYPDHYRGVALFVVGCLWIRLWIVPVLAILVLGYTLYSNLYPVPNPLL